MVDLAIRSVGARRRGLGCELDGPVAENGAEVQVDALRYRDEHWDVWPWLPNTRKAITLT